MRHAASLHKSACSGRLRTESTLLDFWTLMVPPPGAYSEMDASRATSLQPPRQQSNAMAMTHAQARNA